MKLEIYKKIEALNWIIEDQDLLIFEMKARLGFFEDFEKRMEQIFLKSGERMNFHYVKENIIKWNCWLMESLNVHLHNRLFYENRLDLLLQEE